jgi:hypothetical protein
MKAGNRGGSSKKKKMCMGSVREALRTERSLFLNARCSPCVVDETTTTG